MKKTLSILLLGTLALSSCSKTDTIQEAQTKSTDKYVETQVVSEKNFVEDLKLTGKVAAKRSTTISPLSSGLIKTINVKVGDKVKVGDTLATIDTQSNKANISLNTAQDSYQNAVTQFNATKEYLEKNLEASKLQYENSIKTRDNTYSSTQKELELAQLNLDNSKQGKSNTTKTTQTTLNLSQENLNNAQLSLDNYKKTSQETLKSLKNKRKTTIDNIRASVDSSMTLINTSLNSIDEVLGVSELNKKKNDDYEIYLSAKNTGYKNQTESYFGEVYSQFTTLKSKYSQDMTDEEVLAFYSDLVKLSNKMVDLFDKMVLVLDYTITSPSFDDSTLSSFKSSIKSNQSQIISLKSSINSYANALTDVENSLSSTQTDIENQTATLEQSLKIAKLNLESSQNSSTTSLDNANSSQNSNQIQLESTIASIKSSRDNSDNSVSVYKAQYDAALANYNSSLASSKTQLDSALGTKNSSSQDLQNSIIKAPFNGIIVSKSIEVGQMANSSSVAFEISDTNEKIIKIDVSSDNVKYIHLGDNVRIEKNGDTGTGVVSMVGAQSDDKTGMFSVEINVISNDFSNKLSLGDFSDVYVTKEIKDKKSIIIPFSALKVGSDDSYSVFVLSAENKAVEKTVSIGNSNSSEVVIESGLNIGENLITKGVLNISVGDSLKVKN